jgi:hypothetical protein
MTLMTKQLEKSEQEAVLASGMLRDTETSLHHATKDNARLSKELQMASGWNLSSVWDLE